MSGAARVDPRQKTPERYHALLPLRHWVGVCAVALLVTAALFTRCCGHLLGPVAPLLIFPYILGTLLGATSISSLEWLGFAIGLAAEIGIGWWLIRSIVLLGIRRRRRSG